MVSDVFPFSSVSSGGEKSVADFPSELCQNPWGYLRRLGGSSLEQLRSTPGRVDDSLRDFFYPSYSGDKKS